MGRWRRGTGDDAVSHIPSMSLFVSLPSCAALLVPEAWRLRSGGRDAARLRFWAGEEGPWDAEIRVAKAPERRRRIMLSLVLRLRSRRLAGETWRLLLVDALLPAGPEEPLAAGRDLLSALARSRTPDSLERLALARRVAGLVAPAEADAAASWLILGRWMRETGRRRRLPLPEGFLRGILCRGPLGTWGGASDGALAGTIGEIRPPSRHERLRWTADAIAAAERLCGPGAARRLARALERGGISGG